MAFHVISVGISKYSISANNLSYPDKDASQLSAILRHSLTSAITYDVLLRDSEATQIAIRLALNAEALKAGTQNDTLIIYYSGHGDVGKNGNNQNEAYLVPFDAAGDISVSGIATTEFQEWLNGLNHGTKIVLLDCCYSGGANHAKSISRIKHKDLGAIKAFQNQQYAQGTFIFTACKEDETAIEVDELEHGLFTYYLIEEITKDNGGSSVALSSVHDPVTNAVENAAKEYHHTQTPTIQMNAKGSISLPKLSKPPLLRPEIIRLPSTQAAERPPVVNLPQIEVSDKKVKEQLQISLRLIEDVSRNKLSQVTFRSTLSKILNSVRDVYKSQNNSVQTNDELAALLTNLEAQSFQLMLFSAALAIAGEERAIEIFTDEVAQILQWKRGRSGTVAAIETSDVIFLVVLYILFACSIYSDDYKATGRLLNIRIPDSYRGTFKKVIEHFEIHYADALGGNAKIVLSHMISLLQSQGWLIELLGIDEERLKNLVIQSNFCISVALSKADQRLYAGYNDYNLEILSPLISKIRFDGSTKRGIATEIFGSDPASLPQLFSDEVAKINQGGGGHWWHTLSPKSFVEDSPIQSD
jgi:uncharacterized caspase-like protein